jgi:hypothetical protein
VPLPRLAKFSSSVTQPALALAIESALATASKTDLRTTKTAVTRAGHWRPIQQRAPRMKSETTMVIVASRPRNTTTHKVLSPSPHSCGEREGLIPMFRFRDAAELPSVGYRGLGAGPVDHPGARKQCGTSRKGHQPQEGRKRKKGDGGWDAGRTQAYE